jgi:tetratricopeptide (TPR) repeat protein
MNITSLAAHRGRQSCSPQVRRIALAASIALAMLATGCASSGPRGRGSGDYVRSFEAGRYAEAYDLASKASQKGTGFKRDQAALIAGLSAQALNRNAEAEKFLEPLVTSGDPKVNAEASAALGLVYAEAGKHDQAVELLSKAGRDLEGDQAARAFMYAGDSYKSLGKTSEARGMWSLAQTKVTNDAGLRVRIGDRLSAATTPPTPPGPGTAPIKSPAATQFTVQVGAFSNFTNAQKQLSRFRAYGSPRVVEVNRGGKKLFVVRVGQYNNRTDADRVAKNIGAEAKVMTTAGE